MNALRFTAAVAATTALCLALTLKLNAADDTPTAMPQLPKIGRETTATRPVLGDISGAGKSIGGIAPDQLDKSLRAAKRARPPTLRGQAEQKIYAKFARSVVLIVTKESLASGAIINRDGTIITNWHVVDGHKTVGVIFKPRAEGVRVYESDAVQARVVRIDQIADLAIIKVASIPKDIDPIGLADPANLKVGADIHAIGHPMGEIWTYTKGIVSQIRPGYEWKVETSGINHRADVVQTQTPISPGNSGGPLLDDSGNLVGVASFGGRAQALNFAVAGSEIKRFLAATGDRLGSPRQTLAAPPAAQKCAEPATLKVARTEANDGDFFALDSDCNGKADVLLIVFDKNRGITMAIDANENGRMEAVYVDKNADLKFDVVYYDINEDGKADLIGHDLDDNLEPARIEQA
jgi:S1-C subfamily serine protease